jgi:hypothetical protein
MKKWLLILFLLPFLAVAQNKPLKVKLVDYSADKVPAYCGYQTEWGILKFRVKESSNGFKANEIILALFQCPRETMEKGLGLDNYSSRKTYLLTLGERAKPNEIPANPTEIFLEPAKMDQPIYWLTKIELEK